MNRNFLIGCGCLAAIVVAGLVFVLFGARSFWKSQSNWGSTQMADAGRRAAIESVWREPGPRPDATWFPGTVGKWTLSTSEGFMSLPEFQLDRPGWRGKYRGEKQDVQVTIVPVSAEEMDGMFDRAKDALEKGSGSRTSTRMGHRLYVGLNGSEHTRLWWLKDWLFIFHTSGPEDPDAFADAYLSAMVPAELEKK